MTIENQRGPVSGSGPFRVLGLCGSLRQHSRSRTLLDAIGGMTAASVAPGSVAFQVFDHLGHLPLFNPDDAESPAAPVLQLWAAVDSADALIIASPEYAHGVTGTIKNALDWLVGHPPFAGKPIAVLNPSHRADHADESLKETLRTMAADLIPGASVRIPVTACDLSAPQMSCASPYREQIAHVLQVVVRHLWQRSNAWGQEGLPTVHSKHFDAKETT